MDTLSAIKETAAKQFGRDVNTIDADVPFDQLGADSLGLLEFLFELEDQFDISIAQDEVAKLHTLRELAALVDREVAAASAASPPA
jgi:acyl carrier protein